MKNQHFSCIKVFQSDGGAELTSNYFKTHLRTSGIHHKLSCPCTPAQNDRALRKHRHVTETDLLLLFHSHLSSYFWVDAFSTTAHIINRLPTPLLGGKSPFEFLYGYSLYYENFHPFGCRVYPCLHDYMPNKLFHCSISCIFLGYSPSHKGLHCLDPTTTKLYITRHAQLDETQFPIVCSSQDQPLSSLHNLNFLEPHFYHIDSSSLPLFHRTFLNPAHLCVTFVLTLWMSLCRLILLLQVPLCHPRLLIRPLLKLLLIPLLLWALILGSHEPKLVSSRLAIQQILVFWAHLDFLMLFLHPLSQENSNLLLRILL